MSTQLSYEERKDSLNDIVKLVSTLRAGTLEDYEAGVGAIIRNANTLKCDLDAYPPITKRKVTQVTTAPLNTFADDQGATGTINAVFALCDDGTLWLQMLGDGSESGWVPVDDVPQGDFDELNAASNQDEASGD